MLLLPLRAMRFKRSNRHLHHRLAYAGASAIEKHAGERAISVSVRTTPLLPCGRPGAVARGRPSQATSTVRASKAGFEPALSMVRSIRNLHHQRLVEPRDAAYQLQKFCCGALDRAALANPKGSLCHRYPACASFPPTGPALLGARLSGASPGIRVSRSGLRRDDFDRALLRTTKNPPERLAREGSYQTNGRYRLSEIAPMSRACAIDRHKAVRQSDECFGSVLHYRAHVGSRTRCSRGRGKYAGDLPMSSGRLNQSCDGRRDCRACLWTRRCGMRIVALAGSTPVQARLPRGTAR